jgi:glucokinase-like ROK family protein
MALIPGSKKLILRINKTNILNLIKDLEPISRTELSKKSKLSLATVCKIVNSLIDIGLAKEVGEGESSGGRRPILLNINYKSFYLVGIKLSENMVTTALTDLKANLITTLEERFKIGEKVNKIVDVISQSYEHVISESEIPKEKVLGLGIGLPGHIDGKKGVVRYSSILGWENVPLKRILQEKLKIPVLIENDVNTLTIAEKCFGVGKEIDNFICITIGRGIGSGIVVEGEFYRGHLGAAGEFGHIKVKKDGPLCECGSRGCLESISSEPAIIRRTTEAIRSGDKSNLKNILEKRDLNIMDVIKAAKEGDKLSKRIYCEAGMYLGIGIANLTNLLNPQLIIISGEGVKAGDLLFKSMKKSFKESCYPSLREKTDIKIEKLGNYAWARGAATLVSRIIFKEPTILEDKELLMVSSH